MDHDERVRVMIAKLIRSTAKAIIANPSPANLEMHNFAIRVHTTIFLRGLNGLSMSEGVSIE